jgi:DNA repair exonuclease SbcCD ATPase subunit
MTKQENTTMRGSPPLEAGNLATVEEIKVYLVQLEKRMKRERTEDKKEIQSILDSLERIQQKAEQGLIWVRDRKCAFEKFEKYEERLQEEVENKKALLLEMLNKKDLSFEEYEAALASLNSAVNQIEKEREEDAARIEGAMQEALQSIEAERAKATAAEAAKARSDKMASSLYSTAQRLTEEKEKAEKKHAPFEAAQGKGGRGLSLTQKQVRQIIEMHLKEKKTAQEIAAALSVETRQVERVLTVDYKGQPAKRAILAVLNELLQVNQNPQYIARLKAIKEKCTAE